MSNLLICTSIVVRVLQLLPWPNSMHGTAKEQAWRRGTEASGTFDQRRLERNFNTLYLVQQKGLLLHLGLNKN